VPHESVRADGLGRNRPDAEKLRLAPRAAGEEDAKEQLEDASPAGDYIYRVVSDATYENGRCCYVVDVEQDTCGL
jgi:hypothetical protein